MGKPGKRRIELTNIQKYQASKTKPDDSSVNHGSNKWRAFYRLNRNKLVEKATQREMIRADTRGDNTLAVLIVNSVKQDKDIKMALRQCQESTGETPKKKLKQNPQVTHSS